MQKLIEDEKKYILDLCKRIKDAGVELLIIQKSILRESLSSVGLHFLGQMGVLVVDDVDRKEMEHLCKVFNVEAISDISLIKSCGLFRIKEVESFGSKITILERAVDGIETSIKELSIGNSVSEFKSINSVTGDSVITTGRDNKLVGLIQGTYNGAPGIQAGSIGAPGTNKK
ncbi:T-complex protein 1 subunit delta, partial [Dictyocoela roeselum]